MNTILLNRDDMARVIERLAFEILERHASCEDLMLLGIQRRGVDIARRLDVILNERLGARLPFGTLDINLYRDDWTSLQGSPTIGTSSVPMPLDGKSIVLVDDVLFTGRTIRAALEAVLDYGRPRRVELLVLVDRGLRELPIHADYVGRKVETVASDYVDVFLEERDGRDEVVLNRDAGRADAEG
jgi:pyrimidine operon attenuation protein/uracil phosphoribosyltransferase